MDDVFVHPTAVVEPGAQVGAGTKVWHFSHVMSGARIGRDCSLGQNVFVAGDAVISDRVKVQNNVSVYGGVTLEDDVFCGPSAVFTNIRTPRAPYPRKDTEGYATTHVRRGATIGANATVVCGTTIGEWAVVGAGAVVTKDVPPHRLVTGVPARASGWACECGMPLPFEDGEVVCDDCGRKYRETGESIERVGA